MFNFHDFKYIISKSFQFTFLGAFGNVRVGWTKANKNTKYAVKTMKKAEIIKSKHVDHIENEKNILDKI